METCKFCAGFCITKLNTLLQLSQFMSRFPSPSVCSGNQRSSRKWIFFRFPLFLDSRGGILWLRKADTVTGRCSSSILQWDGECAKILEAEGVCEADQPMANVMVYILVAHAGFCWTKIRWIKIEKLKVLKFSSD